MSINSYSTLQTAVENWSHKAGLTTLIPDFITLGEARIYGDLRIRCMETALSSTIASGVIAVPAGYVELKNAYINESTAMPLQRKDAKWIYQKYPTRSAEGLPKFIAREGDNFIFGPYPDSAYTVKGIYYKRLDALSDSNTTNWFTANEPGILLYAALYELADYTANSEAMTKWGNKYAQERDRIQAANDAEEFSGSVLSMSAV